MVRIARGLLLLFAALLVTSVSASAQVKPVKIGWVDIERINKEYPKIKMSVELLNDSFRQFQTDLDLIYERVEEASAVKNRLQARFDQEQKDGGSSTVSQDDVQAALKDWVQKRDEYFAEYRRLSQRFETAKDVLLYPRLVEVSQAVRMVGEQGGYSVILKKDLAKYSAARNDVTDEVLKRLNELSARRSAAAGSSERGQ